MHPNWKQALALALTLVVTPVHAQPGAARHAPGAVEIEVASPAGWRRESTPKAVVVVAPDDELRVEIVKVGPAADAHAAVEQAWRARHAGALPPLTLASPLPGRNGWDARLSFTFESPTIGGIVQALVLRRGAEWFVAVTTGSAAAADKRGAALRQLLDGLHPKDVNKETFAGRIPARLTPERVATLRRFLADAMARLDVPGVGLALIDHGRVVYEGGLGVRELGGTERVDAHTRFMVASNTKGMTTLLLAKLVDEGKLAWDEPVTQVYPAFRLGRAETTAKVRVRHLVCACTGLPRRDTDWFFNTSRATPPSATFAQLALSEPTSGFGEVYQYNNLMAAAAGYVAGQTVYPGRDLGDAYDAAMQRLIFDPLGMKDTTFSMAKALAGDHASPHGDDLDGRPHVVSMAPNYTETPYRPAGGAWSSAHDMILYVGNELSQGVAPGGERLFSAANLLARRAHGVPIGDGVWYGMGLTDDRTWGVSVIRHGGSMIGFKSDIMIVPDAQIGAVVLTNADSGRLLLRPFMRRLLEVIYDGAPEAEGDLAAAVAQEEAARAAAGKALTVPPDAADAASLAPAYFSPELGPLKVVRRGADTRFEVTSWSSAVGARRAADGALTFMTIDPSLVGLEFAPGVKDGRRTLITRDAQHEYVFVEQ